MDTDFHFVERFIMNRISKYRIPSLVISIVRNYEIIYTRGFGFRDIENLIPTNPETLYGVGSVTKSFTALAILQLVQEGKIELDDSIKKYVDVGFKFTKGEITIHHLLTHSSGIPALAYAEAFIRSSLGLIDYWLPIFSSDDVLSFMGPDVEDWIYTEPGERFFYLNEGYVILGKIISKVSGKPYEKYIRDRILKPLKMNRSCFLREEVEKLGNWAIPYVIDKDGSIVKSEFPFGVTADGGLISTVLDLSNYIMMYLGRGRFGGKELLEQQYIELMEKEHIKEPYEYPDREYYYGYGWGIIKNFYNLKLIQHSGSVLVHTAYVGYIPERGLGISILANPSQYPLSLMGQYILGYLLGENPEDLEFVKRERILKKLEGRYTTYKKTMSIDIKKSSDFLIATRKTRLTEQTTILVPEELREDRAIFYTLSHGAKLRVEFIISENRVDMIFDKYRLIKYG